MADDIDMDRLLVIAEERQVKFLAGGSFNVRGEKGPYLRLAFGFPPVEEIEAGVAKLAACIRDARRS
jgi:DNA-binding transcriptional MocR family regulator